MTQIVSCLTRDAVVMAADRRLTMLPSGDVVDDEACKVVLLGRQVAVSFTGLANIAPAPRMQTDLWLMEVMNPPGPSLDATFAKIRFAANHRFGLITHVGPKAKRHAFVAVGMASDSKGGPVRPFHVTISNALSRNGSWLPSAAREFGFQTTFLPSKSDFRVIVTGQPLTKERRALLNSTLAMPSERTPGRVASHLANAIRATADTNATVGKGLLVTVLPRATATRTGGIVALGPGDSVDLSAELNFPEVPVAVSFYVPADNRKGEVYAPRYIDENVSVTAMRFWNRELSLAEVEREMFPLMELMNNAGP